MGPVRAAGGAPELHRIGRPEVRHVLLVEHVQALAYGVGQLESNCGPQYQVLAAGYVRGHVAVRNVDVDADVVRGRASQRQQVRQLGFDPRQLLPRARHPHKSEAGKAGAVGHLRELQFGGSPSASGRVLLPT